MSRETLRALAALAVIVAAAVAVGTMDYAEAVRVECSSQATRENQNSRASHNARENHRWRASQSQEEN